MLDWLQIDLLTDLAEYLVKLLAFVLLLENQLSHLEAGVFEFVHPIAYAVHVDSQVSRPLPALTPISRSLNLQSLHSFDSQSFLVFFDLGSDVI